MVGLVYREQYVLPHIFPKAIMHHSSLRYRNAMHMKFTNTSVCYDHTTSSFEPEPPMHNQYPSSPFSTTSAHPLPLSFSSNGNPTPAFSNLSSPHAIIRTKPVILVSTPWP